MGRYHGAPVCGTCGREHGTLWCLGEEIEKSVEHLLPMGRLDALKQLEALLCTLQASEADPMLISSLAISMRMMKAGDQLDEADDKVLRAHTKWLEGKGQEVLLIEELSNRLKELSKLRGGKQ